MIQARPWHGRSIGLAGVIVLALAATYAFFAQRHFDFITDPAVYAGLAKRIASGESYWFNGRPHIQYPPGYPALLAPVAAIWTDSFIALSRYTAALCSLGIIVVAVYCQTRDIKHWFVLPCMMVLSAGYFRHATRGVESDVPFLIATIALLAYVESLHRRLHRVHVVVSSGIAGVLLVAVLSLRTIGVAMFAALVVTASVHVWRHHGERYARSRALPRPVIASLFGALLIGAPYLASWTTWTVTRRTSLYEGEFAHSYSAQLRLADPHRPDLGQASVTDVLLRVPKGIIRKAAHGAEHLTNIPWFHQVWFAVPVVVVVIFTTIGIVLELRRENPLMGWYVLGSVAILSLWPFDEGGRFALPLFPLFALLCVRGSAWFLQYAKEHTGDARMVALCVCAVGLVGALASVMRSEVSSLQDQAALLIWTVGVMGLLAGARNVVGLLERRSLRRFITAGYLGAYALLGIRGIIRTAAERLDMPQGSVLGLTQAASWIRSHTEPADVPMAFNAAGLHYATGRRTVPFPVSGDTARLRQAIAALQPDYLIVQDTKRYEYFFPTQRERLEIIRAGGLLQLSQETRFEGTSLFRVSVPMADVLRGDDE